MYQTVDNQKTLANQNAEIAKRLDKSLAARNKLYEANSEHTREFYKMKQQIKSLEEKKAKFQEQLQTAQACKYLNLLLAVFCQKSNNHLFWKHLKGKNFLEPLMENIWKDTTLVYV